MISFRVPTNPIGGIAEVGFGVSSAGGVNVGDGEAKLGDPSGVRVLCEDGVFSDWGVGEAVLAAGAGLDDVSGVGEEDRIEKAG